MSSRPRRIARRAINALGLRRKRISWLFLLGVNNSGTTLLETILGRHPEISELPEEGQLLSRALPRPNPLKVRRLWTERLEAFRKRSGDGGGLSASRLKWDWLGHYPVDGRSRFLMEKSPPNTVRGPWLQHHFKPASFLALTRSPYAVAEGIRRREGHSVERAARHWTIANQIMLDDHDQLDDALLLSYEDLCADPSKEMTRVTRFLKIDPYPDEFLRESLPIHNVTEQPSLIKDFNESSLEKLSADDIRRIEDIAGDVMRRLGYDFATG
ncbi:MAG: sulfotransferase [Phycisphaerales bacterium]|nr:sulfotransferase [Phycisphaerales bacterium]